MDKWQWKVKMINGYGNLHEEEVELAWIMSLVWLSQEVIISPLGFRGWVLELKRIKD